MRVGVVSERSAKEVVEEMFRRCRDDMGLLEQLRD
jgi:hypothetical protein